MIRASFLARRRHPLSILPGINALICEIWATARVSLWLGRSIAEVGILFLTVESKLAAAADAQSRFGAGVLVRFCGALECSETQTNRAFLDPGGGQNRVKQPQFRV
jgi:hypothetical protein